MTTISKQPALHMRIHQARRVGAWLAGLTAAAYLFLGFGVVSVFEGDAQSRPAFFAAALVYALGAYLLSEFEVESLWVLGATLQAIIVGIYFGVALEREPSFDPWGIAIVTAQIVLMAVLVVLAVLTHRAHRHAITEYELRTTQLGMEGTMPRGPGTRTPPRGLR